MSRLAACLVALLCAAACDPSGPARVELSWSFADGRPCDLAGAQHVEVRGASASPTRVDCEDGLAPGGSQELEVERATGELTLEALSYSGAVLYRGRCRVSPGGGPCHVTLRFVGGE